MAAVDAEADPSADGIQKARAEASVRIAEHYLAGTPGCDGECGGCCDRPRSARPARPTIIVHVDVAVATQDRFGQLLRLASGGADGTLSARMTDLLAEHADLIVQVRDGARPVLELVARDSEAIPAQIRRMVERRDRGCRFPDCRAAWRQLHVHHIVHVADGGTHDPDNLLVLCSFHHLRYVHRLGWQPALDGATGRVTWTNTRTGTTMSTMPHGTRPRPARDPELLPDWLAPPRSPPPTHLEPPRDPDPPDHWTAPPPDLHQVGDPADPPDTS